MKRIKLFCFLFIAAISLTAQTDLIGTWKGAIKIPGMNLDIIIELNNQDNNWSGTLDIPIQMIDDMVLADLIIKDDSVSFKLPEVPGNASFSGVYDNYKEEISGTFRQGGASLPMVIKRENAADKAAAAAKLAEQLALIKMKADSFLIAREHTGLALAIVKDGEIVMTAGFGYRDIENKKPVDSKTLFGIGSTSKAFTTMGLSMLGDDGLLDWETPVKEYLPDFQLYDAFATTEATALDLVTHRSGLPRHDLLWYGSPLSRQEMYQRLRYLEPNKSFRSTWQYQNLMYMTAGMLTEKLSGKTWEAFTKERIFDPLGMTSANFSVELMKKSPDAALPYQRPEEHQTDLMEYRNIDAIGPAGSINANIEDMAKWIQFLVKKGKVGDERLLSERSFINIMSPHMTMPALNTQPGIDHAAYGLGWMIYDQMGTKIIEHGGNIDGFSALVWLVPNENIGIVALTNMNGSGLPGVVARTATDILLDKKDGPNWYERSYANPEKDKEEEKENEEGKKEEQRTLGTTPHYAMSQYAGVYEHPGYGKVTIAEQGDSLKVLYNFIDLPLSHWHYEVFNAKDKKLDLDIKMHFIDDAKGKVIAVASTLEAMVDDIVFDKLPSSKQSDPAFLKLLVGKYDLGGQQVEIKIEGETKLTAILPGQPVYTLEPYQDNEFKLKGLNGFSCEFTFDEGKKVPSGLKFIQPNGVFTAKKVE
jgi:CubicO group peptidase (beta-lactamase class C family)